jgi:hypothetical protein
LPAMRRLRSISRSPLVIAIGDAVPAGDYSFKVVKVRRSDVGPAS